MARVATSVRERLTSISVQEVNDEDSRIYDVEHSGDSLLSGRFRSDAAGSHRAIGDEAWLSWC